MVDDQNNHRKISKRSFLKAVGAGSGITSIGGLNVTVASATGSGNYVKIPTAKRGTEVIETEKVSKKWYNMYNTAKEVTHHLQKKTAVDENISHVEIGASSDYIEDDVRGFEIRIGAHNQSAAADRHPSSSNGVPIRIIEAEETRSTCANRGTYSSMSGGIANSHAGGGKIYHSTTSCRVKRNGNFYMLNCAHVFFNGGGNGSCEGLGGHTAYQSMNDHSNRKYGEPARWNNVHDWCIVAKNNSNGINYNGRIQFPDGSRYGIGGHYTEYKINRMVTSYEQVTKIGISSGKTTGRVASTNSNVSNGSNCISMDGAGVKVTNNQADGDSGAPVFHFVSNGDPPKCYMVSIATQTPNGSKIGTACNNNLYNYGIGWPAYKMSNQANIQFYTGY